MNRQSKALSRREFLQVGAAGAAALAARPSFSAPTDRRPNFLFVITDQQWLEAVSAHGCPYLRTPHLDRLASQGVSFTESHSANPVCGPARSCLFTGRAASETGVIRNELGIRDDIPNVGQWLGQRGYDPVYVGKWHLPQSYTVRIPGFEVIPAGNNGNGTLLDRSVSRAAQGWLHQRKTADAPFFLVASFLQPHDICQWTSMHHNGPVELPYPELADELAPLPANHLPTGPEPATVSNWRQRRGPKWTETQWRHYLWAYYRMVEEVDAEIGRVLQALESSALADNTIVIFTSDHGEGCGGHRMILKNYLYEESLKVPLIISCPGRLQEGQRDRRLVSGVDIVPTVCDYAGIDAPPKQQGRSLRPLLEGKPVEWREAVLSEVVLSNPSPGYMLRTDGYKYITYNNDPAEQLFDMRNDPGEIANLAADRAHAELLQAHRKLLREQWARFELAPAAPQLILPG